MPKKKRPHGHYCKICGEHKANEKFSGKGHTAHICNACSRLSIEDKSLYLDMNRLSALQMKQLTDSDKKWLKKRVHDKRPEVAEMARMIFDSIFPYAERNAMKKQLHIQRFAFEIHTEVWDDSGNCYMANQRFLADRKGSVLSMKDLDTDRSELCIT